MITASFFDDLGDAHRQLVQHRRAIVVRAGEGTSLAKRAIFAFHRDDRVEATALLAKCVVLDEELQQHVAASPLLADEGTYRAFLEEWTEAVLYGRYLDTGGVGAVPGHGVSSEAYLAALADLCGELQRRQVRLASSGNGAGAKAIHADIESVVGAMLGMDLEGYLRTKFDQARNALRRSEEVVYDLAIRGK
jgi:predicted translin family RNA/ssDNA-binding protein